MEKYVTEPPSTGRSVKRKVKLDHANLLLPPPIKVVNAVMGCSCTTALGAKRLRFSGVPWQDTNADVKVNPVAPYMPTATPLFSVRAFAALTVRLLQT